MSGRGGGEPELHDPGPTGITLTEYRLTRLEDLVKESREDFGERIQKNEDRITKLETWRTFILGATAAASVMVGAFAKQALDYLGGPHHP